MRATNDKLAERYITVVARELSKALKGLHDAGIMHRDVKGKLVGCGSWTCPFTCVWSTTLRRSVMSVVMPS